MDSCRGNGQTAGLERGTIPKRGLGSADLGASQGGVRGNSVVEVRKLLILKVFQIDARVAGPLLESNMLPNAGWHGVF